MKKAILTISMLLCTLFFLILVWPTQPVSFWEIPVLEANALDDLIAGRTQASSILSFQCHAGNEALPIDKQSRTWYTPALTKELALDLPWPWHVARTETTADPTDGDTCRILFYNNRHCFEYTLVETGLPVVSIELLRFDLLPRQIDGSRTKAIANILTQGEHDNLQLQKANIEIKRRGVSSLAYDKKSYTIFMRNASRSAAKQSILGLSADRKYALNSMYEDDSKIRDALAYHVSSQLSPDHAMQFTYAELLINDSYLGLYGVQQIITETTMHAAENDIIYKIDDHYITNGAPYSGGLPYYDIVYGTDPNAETLQHFFAPLQSEMGSFPSCYDLESFLDYALQMEILACRDTELKNMAITYLADQAQFRLTGWDMDVSFGLNWNIDTALNVEHDPAMVSIRFLAESDTYLEPLSMLYTSCPAFAEAVAARYRELRETVFTDEALLQKAKSLYDPLTVCGARQRDAERWPNSAISEDNSFIEEFIPARMAFLDGVFHSND